MKLPVNSGLVSPDTFKEILNRVNVEENILSEEQQKELEDKLVKKKLTTIPIEEGISDTIEDNRYNINDILNELITDPHTIRFRIKMKDALERVLGILIRYQHLMDIKRGISRGEICRNLAVKYRKNLDYILFELENCKVISVMNEHGRNYYKINRASFDAAKVLKESLRNR
jgi:hypothetical protein